MKKCLWLFTCFSCSSFVHFWFTFFFSTRTPFSLSCLAFILFFILSTFLFFIQCPSPYPPHSHTKHAVIAKKFKKKKNSSPHTTMHTHTMLPPLSSSSSINMCSMHMPGCVGCVSALHVPAATRLQQHTPKTKTKQTKIHSDECTAWHTWHAEKTSLGKAHTHTHRHGGSKARTPAAETMRALGQGRSACEWKRLN